MKPVLYLAGGLICLLTLGGVVIGLVADSSDGPRQSFKLINTGVESRSVTFEGINADGSASDTWFINELVKPNDFVIKRIPAGKYKIVVWDAKELSVATTEFEFELPNAHESNYELYRFDLAVDKKFVVATSEKNGKVQEWSFSC